METCSRSIAKAVSWQVLGFITTSVIMFFYTGDMAQAAGMTLSLTLVALVMYVLHERIWQFVGWGRQKIEMAVEMHSGRDTA